MQTVARSNFTTVKTEGAILPADLLQRIADGQLDGLQPETYHLLPTERLNEAINRAWNRCLGVWQSFEEQREKLPPSDSGVSLTRNRWLLILLHELGYGNLPFQRSIELEDGSSYPISHQWGEHTPLHLVSFRQELDRRDAAIKRSPHSLMQEFLNRSDNHLWGFVSNGLTLRVLRDNVSLTRAAYLEFDLEAMLTGEVYADFSLLWLVCHQSRVEVGSDVDAPQLPSNCWLEQWSQTAVEQGTRALDALRNGVQEAIAALGRGFLAHPANADLRSQLKRGTLNTQNYYRELLRLVYRLIFLFVAEDRDLLLLPECDAEVRQRYSDYYALGRLRQLAVGRRGGPHPDLYRTLRQVCFLLRDGYAPLGLPALGSFLFSERATPTLDGVDIANHDLLEAIRALAFTIEGKVRRPVDYKNLGAEELGSVYESLLELHPQLNVDAATFALDAAAGSERKTTGSYYTPSSLITSLLDSALEPVVADRLKVAGGKVAGDPSTQYAIRNTPDPKVLEKAILDIKVVDPACGSGHFLIAAANRLAVHLARVRTGDDEPGPAARRDALRAVVRHCIHGVDINEMAVELCKVALWMETLDPGKPLGFLDRNIQCGNSLMGATPALLARGIPDDAFKPITGDDKAYCREWKKRNKEEQKQTSMRLDAAQPWDRLGDLATAMAQLDGMGDGTIDAVRQQETGYAKLVRSSAYEYSRLWADTWCAAFVWHKNYDFAYPITEGVYRKIERNPFDVAPWMRAEIERLRDEYQFFHFHLAFPHVFTPKAADSKGFGDDDDVTGWAGGFDVVLGNPPWERIQIEEKQFFELHSRKIAQARSKERKRLIEKLKNTNPPLHLIWVSVKRKSDGESHIVKNSQHFPLTGSGNINKFAVFSELGSQLIKNGGCFGVIVPSGLITEVSNKALFEKWMFKNQLISAYDFENRKGFFPSVDSRARFTLLTVSSSGNEIHTPQFGFMLQTISDLSDADKLIHLSNNDIEAINPESKTVPPIRSSRDAQLLANAHNRFGVFFSLEKPNQNSWDAVTRQMVNTSHDRRYLIEANDLIIGNMTNDGLSLVDSTSILRLYDGKMLDQYNHRLASVTYATSSTFRTTDSIKTTHSQYVDPHFLVIPQYWIDVKNINKRVPNYVIEREWLICYREVTASTNWRTVIASVVPFCGLVHKIPALYSKRKAKEQAVLLGVLNSFPLDYFARLKISGTSLSHFLIRQFPIPPLSQIKFSNLWGHDALNSFANRVLELVYTSCDLVSFARDCGYHGPPYRWDEARRLLLRCELDAAYFHLYGIERDDVDYIMETFPIVKRKDEKAYGDYRTKRVILEIYDEMAEAMRSGQPYQTRLDPPPAHPDAAHPWDESYLGPELPREQWWQEVELDVSPDPAETPVQNEAVSPAPASVARTLKEPPAKYQTQQEPDVLELHHPQPPSPKKKAAKPAPASQKPLLEVLPPPSGPRTVRLKRVMALGKDQAPVATRELVAFLADGDSSIRWLAGSSLVQRANNDTVAAIAAFITGAEAERVTAAKPEMLRVLGLIVETAVDERIRAAAQQTLDRL